MIYFVMTLKEYFTYRWQVVFKIFSAFIVSIATIYLWKYIYSNDFEMQRYMVQYTIISNIISIFYTEEISENISKKIYDGTFVVELIRPVSFLRINIIQSMGTTIANAIIKVIPLILLFYVFYRRYLSVIFFYNVIFFLFSLCLAFWLHTCMYATLGFLAFKFYEVWPFNRLLRDTIRFFSGAFIPISLFPGWLAKIADVLPFQCLYSFPIEMLIKRWEICDVYIGFIKLIIWNIIMCIVLLVVYKKSIVKCVVQGG